MAGKLYVVGTPIGNLEDLSPRALRTLRQVDFIAAEDTRVTLKLLNRFDIKKDLISYFEHNKKERGETVIKRLLGGETAALVTDAGMPAISDPGEDLVRAAREAGIAVESVPGPTAFATAAAISGFPCGRFCFEGFLSADRKSRISRLEELKEEKRTLIFYEAPHKIVRTLSDMKDIFGDREIALCKELTKIHETVFCTTLEQACLFYSENTPKGEYVLIVKGALEKESRVYTVAEAADMARKLMQSGMSASAAAKQAATETGIKKGEIYKIVTS